MTPKVTLKGISVGQLVQMEFTKKTEILGPWLKEGNLVLIYANRGLGKTFFALQIAQAVATEGTFLKWKAGKSSSVCLFDGEMGLESLSMRVGSIIDNSEVEMGRDAMKIVTFEHFGLKMPNLSDPEDQEIYTAESAGSDLIIIDNLLTCSRPMDSRLHDNETAQWGRIQEWLIKMRQAGKSVVLIHHAGKSGSQLGTSQRENIMDTVIALKKPARNVMIDGFQAELYFEKHRNFYGKDTEPLFIEYETSEWGSTWKWSTLRAQVYCEVMKLHEEGVKVKDIALMLNLSSFEIQSVIQL
ncbi:AAA family ATPase [Patescibacteria group bacterium]|nr:AAA family ATPase [Patescibacteria group bacterium]